VAECEVSGNGYDKALLITAADGSEHTSTAWNVPLIDWHPTVSIAAARSSDTV